MLKQFDQVIIVVINFKNDLNNDLQIHFFYVFFIKFVIFSFLLRLLVGLRWWNEFKDDGSQIWLYESQAPTYVPNNENSFYFWIP